MDSRDDFPAGPNLGFFAGRSSSSFSSERDSGADTVKTAGPRRLFFGAGRARPLELVDALTDEFVLLALGFGGFIVTGAATTGVVSLSESSLP